MKGRERLTTHDIGEWLELRRRNNQQTILLLGSQAGALYRSIPFYNYCQQYTTHNLQTHSPAWSFRACYEVLMRNQLGERELHALLQDIFKNVRNLLGPYDGDGYFAEIVRKGYFREIISTNIDDLVEQALHHAGLIEKKDFEVFIAGKQPPPQQRELPYRLTKVFGDWQSREYMIYNRQTHISSNAALNSYLHTILHGNVLAIGIDPLWDGAILPLLRDAPTSLWFVGKDEGSIYDQQIAAILHQEEEKSVAIVGENHGYEEFWRTLYQQLGIKNITIAGATYYQRSMSLNKDERDQTNRQTVRVLYVYCDEDLPMMEKFWKHLHVLRTNKLIAEWHRGSLTPGDHLQVTLERELNSSQLIFVGFSNNFLASEYYDQATQAFRLSQTGTVKLIPLLLSPVGNWKQTPFSEISPLPQGGRTLSDMTTRELERELSKIADNIHKLIISLQKGENS
jgi:hypothetical protein